MKRHFKKPAVLFAAAVATLAGATLARATPVATLYTGGDVGEGLDLQNDAGGFVYALDFRDTVGASLAVADVTFQSVTASSAPAGVTVTTYGLGGFDNLVPFNLGASASDDNLELVAQSMVEASNGANHLDLTLAVTPGASYTLQILTLANAGAHRSGDYTINGVTTFVSLPTVAGASPLTHSWVVTDTFTAASSSLQIVIQNTSDGNDSFPQGLTLELVPEPASLALVALGGVALLRRRRV